MGNCLGGVLAGGFILIWGLFWTAGTLFFDYTCAKGLYQQHSSKQYASTEGQVVSSGVDTSRDSDGSSYTPKIHYRYQVKGREYHGERIRYGTAFNTYTLAHAFAAQHPALSTVTVYYDPRNPSESLLQTGINGTDLFFIIFLVPFNAIMFGCWWFVLGALRNWISPPVAGGVRIIDDGLATRVRLPEKSAAAWGVGTLTLVSFASIFVIAFGSGGNPSLSTTVVAIIVAVGTGAYVYNRIDAPVRAGEKDLVIDEARRCVTLPCTQARAFPVDLALAQLRRVDVELETTSDGEGGVNKTYIPALVYRENDAERKARLKSFSDEKLAAAFAMWLEQRLRLKSTNTATVENL